MFFNDAFVFQISKEGEISKEITTETVKEILVEESSE